MAKVAELIVKALKNANNEPALKEIKQQVNNFIGKFELFSKEWL